MWSRARTTKHHRWDNFSTERYYGSTPLFRYRRVIGYYSCRGKSSVCMAWSHTVRVAARLTYPHYNNFCGEELLRLKANLMININYRHQR